MVLNNGHNVFLQNIMTLQCSWPLTFMISNVITWSFLSCWIFAWNFVIIRAWIFELLLGHSCLDLWPLSKKKIESVYPWVQIHIVPYFKKFPQSLHDILCSGEWDRREVTVTFGLWPTKSNRFILVSKWKFVPFEEISSRCCWDSVFTRKGWTEGQLWKHDAVTGIGA